MAYSELQWPFDPTNPLPLLDGYAEGLQDNVLRTDFDTNVPRERVRGSSALEMRTATYIFNATQKDTFKQFAELSKGRSFWWPDPVYNYQWRYARLKRENWDKLFIPTGGGEWQVNLNFELWIGIIRGQMEYIKP